MVLVLGVEVSSALFAQWRDWLAPPAQPFFVDRGSSVADRSHPTPPINAELRDTWQLWNVDKTLGAIWLTEDAFAALPKRERAALVRAQVRHRRGAVPTVRGWSSMADAVAIRHQADGHRFVWWPSLVPARRLRPILARVVSTDRLPSRHREVPPSTWKRARGPVPEARRLAGTFPDGSGANCFATVMAAFGLDVAESWVQVDQFERWLEDSTNPGGVDDQPATVLVWRDAGRSPHHAAVTLGDGWALEKPSQEWSSPRAVLPVREVIRTSRARALRLHRYTAR